MRNNAPAGERSNSNLIKSVETSITIVELLKQRRTETVTEIANQTGFSPAAVSKHLTTLRKHGFVRKEAGTYRLGLRYLDIGGFVRENLTGSHVVKEEVVKLAAETGEVAEYIVESDGKAVVVYRELGDQGISGRTRVGSHLSIHQVAAGKAILAHMPMHEVEEVIREQGLERATENTITDEAELYEELEAIRDRGYAINDEESTEGLYAIAAPTTIADSQVIGACAVSGPAYRMKDEAKLEQMVEVLFRTVNEIELTLSYS